MFFYLFDGKKIEVTRILDGSTVNLVDHVKRQ
jgi:hypothetical protein